MIALAEARALVRDPLWPRLSELLWGFAPLVDPARRAAVLPAAAGAEPPEAWEPGNARADAWVLSRLGVEPAFHAFPADDGSRLLLLPVDDLLALADRLGAVAHAPALRRVMDGAKVRALRAALPGVYPDALRLEAYFHAWRDLLSASAGDASEPAAPAIRLGGLRLLATALSALPPQLALRLRLRLPPDLDPGFEPLAGADPAAALAAARKMLQLTNPEGYAQCFS